MTNKLTNIELDYMFHTWIPKSAFWYERIETQLQLPNPHSSYREGLPKFQQDIMDNAVLQIISELIIENHDVTTWIKDKRVGGFQPIAHHFNPNITDAYYLNKRLLRYDYDNDRYLVALHIAKSYRLYDAMTHQYDTPIEVWRQVRKAIRRAHRCTDKTFEKGMRIAHQIITGKKCDIRTVLKQTT